MNLPVPLRALRHRNFRLYVAGQGTGHIGLWLQLITTSWLVYQLSGSTVMLGLAAFAMQIPYLVVSPLAGVLIDRLDARRVLYMTNCASLGLAALMLGLVGSGVVQAWHLVACNLLIGINNSLDVPARQAMLVRLVDRKDLPNAIALNSGVMNSARFVGPMIGGAITALFGAAWSLAANCLLRMVVLAALAALRLADHVTAKVRTSWRRDLAAGLSYAFGFLPTRSALLLLAATSFTVQSFGTLLPWFARQRFMGDSDTLGMMFSAVSLGAVTAMVHLAMLPSLRGLLKGIGLSAVLAGASLTAFALLQNLWIALPMLFLSGFGMMLTAAGTNTLLQTVASDELRGRVAALYVFTFFGIPPLGSLASGWLAAHWGGVATMALYGAAAVAAALVYCRSLPAIQQQIEPVLDQLGL